MTTWYADSSALVKLILPESESSALRAHLGTQLVTTSTLALAEVPRTLARAAPISSWNHAWTAITDRLQLVVLDQALITRAAQLPPPTLRTLDAIHLESALTVSAGLDGVLVYDRRLAQACRDAGLVVASPGQQP